MPKNLKISNIGFSTVVRGRRIPLYGWVLLPLIFLISTGNAQDQLKKMDILSRKNYIETYDNHFFIWPVVTQKSTSFIVQSSDHSRKLVFKPNFTYHVGVGAYIFGIGYQLVFALPQSKSDILQHGKSKALSLQASFKGKNWGVDVFTSNYVGFYQLDQSATQIAVVPTLPRQDVKTWNSGASGFYFFNKRTYSMRATDNYYERQLKSAGSILLRANLNIFSIRADSAIYDQSSVFGTEANFQKIRYTTLGIAPGYAYNFIFKHSFFVNASVAIGPAVNWFRYYNNTGNSNSTSELNTSSDLRCGAGYNGKRFFAGVNVIHQSTHISYKKTEFINVNDGIRFAAGYRFHEAGVMKRRAKDFLKAKGR